MLSELQRELEDVRSSATPADARLAELFLGRIVGWKQDQATPKQLIADLDRTLGQVWFSKDEVHERVFRLLEAFRPTVQSLGSMTMNERLVLFNLIDVWDQASDDGRQALYGKLEAKSGLTSSCS